MELRQARPGAAVELPQGVYTLDRVTHCRATALEWLIFELVAEEATVPGSSPPSSAGGCPHCPTLALIADRLYEVVVTAAEALPDDAALTVEQQTYRRRHRGEARGERSGRTGHADFWLGQYRHYEGDSRVLIFMDVHGEIQCLTGKAMDLRLVRAY